MLTDKMYAALNDQIKHELYSAYLYLSMATYYADQNLDGFAHWMEVQAQEEVEHAMKIYKYIQERGNRVILQQIDAPTTEFENPTAPFAAALKHEQYVTSLINNLYTLATEENDYATQVFLQWFVTEQVEEEDNVGKALHLVEQLSGAPAGLILADKQLGKREEE
ncbi:MAG TPA: ferritin [Firmicutes bacterium]|jgi:ferritin|nr:ferritin [Bacillota bacterium]